MAYADQEQYPHIRAMTLCLACGGGKTVGLLVCWPCHNELKMVHDVGYGLTMERVLLRANDTAEANVKDRT